MGSMQFSFRAPPIDLLLISVSMADS